MFTPLKSGTIKQSRIAFEILRKTVPLQINWNPIPYPTRKDKMFDFREAADLAASGSF
jgi:hypothetical protein